MANRKCSNCRCSGVKSYVLVFLGILHRFLKVLQIFGVKCPKQKDIQQQTNSKGISSYQITRTLKFITQEETRLEFDPQTFKLTNPTGKPLCVMLTWMFAKQKHIDRYAEIYLEQGFDILTVALTAVDVMWPPRGTKVTAANVARFLYANESTGPVTLHGFSSGAYMWGEVCLFIADDQEKYKSLLTRVVAQVWDSVVDVQNTQKGLSMALFPDSKFKQKMLTCLFELYFKLFHNAVMIPMMRTSAQFYNAPCLAPALLFASSIDPLGCEMTSIEVKKIFNSLGIKVTLKCWNDSPHVQHLVRHPKEYLTLLYNHLVLVGLLKDQEKMNIRIK